jgi:hypothetical protein
MRVPGHVPSFEGAGPRFSSFGHPSHVQPQPGGSLASRPAIERQSDGRFSNLRNHVVSQHNANWHNDWDRRHAHFNHGRFLFLSMGFGVASIPGITHGIIFPIIRTTITPTTTTRTSTRTITTGPTITLIQRIVPR